jgi:inorganic pyrophosphatase
MQSGENLENSSKILYRSHPWHGVSMGQDAPNIVNCYIEMVPTDTVKYELDKDTGLLKIDRPQKYSSLCPTLYGFIPRTHAGENVAKHCREQTGRKDIVGDDDPIDICIFTDNVIPRGDIILKAIPIGGLRMLDDGEADDKIIAIMVDDFVYEKFKDISNFPDRLIERLRHYFLTYKQSPDSIEKRVEITDIYGAEEARQIIQLSSMDYQAKFPTIV